MAGCSRVQGPDDSSDGNPGTPAQADKSALEETDLGERTECEDGTIADAAFSVSDDRLLVGFADNVGRVEKKLGATGLAQESTMAAMISTQFSVEVIENVKGRLDGLVSVNQEGAYVPDLGCAVLVNGDPLLDRGQEYLFLTSRDGRYGRHQIVASGYGDVPVDSASERRTLVQRFERAEKDQVDPTPGRR